VTHQLAVYVRSEAGCRNPVQDGRQPASGYSFSRLGWFSQRQSPSLVPSPPKRSKTWHSALERDQTSSAVTSRRDFSPQGLSGIFSAYARTSTVIGFENVESPNPIETGMRFQSSPNHPAVAPREASIANLLLDCEQVRPGVHSATHHSWQDECRYQEAPGGHIRFPNLSLRPE
jgi:hypothetical protein